MSPVVGLGLDVVDVERFAVVMRRRPRLAQRIFTPNELAQCGSNAKRLAARFAAREATWKALGVGVGGVGFRDVSVRTLPSGAPVLELTGTAQRRALNAGIAHWHVSLTHTALTAAAVVVGENSDAS